MRRCRWIDERWLDMTLVVPSGIMLIQSPLRRSLRFHLGDAITVLLSVIAYASGARDTRVTFISPCLSDRYSVLALGTLIEGSKKSVDHRLLSPRAIYAFYIVRIFDIPPATRIPSRHGK